MKKLLFILAFLLPSIAFAQLTVPQGGTGTTTFPDNYVLIGTTNPLRITAVSTSSLGISGGGGGSTFATTSISATYPILWNTSTAVISTAYGTTTANSWSQLQMFNGGLTAYATSTIGNGTQAGGLTISGGATTTGNAYFAGATTFANATSTNLFSTTASSTNLFSQTASFGTLNLVATPNSVLSTNSSGQVVATTSIGVNYLSGVLPIANGGTDINSQTSNGVNYFDGTHITSSSNLTWNGGTLNVLGSGAGAALSVSGTVSNASGVNFLPIVQSSGTTQQEIIDAQAGIQPTGATLGSIYGLLFLPSLSNSATPITQENGVFSRLDEAASYTGTVSTAKDFYAAASNPAGNPYTNYYGFFADGTKNGDGTTTGTVTNIGIQINGTTASSSAGGTINNYAGVFTVPSGSPNGGTTNNYGLYLSGNGGNSNNGGTANNYSFYNNSTANSYFAGNVGIASTTPGSLLSVGNTQGINFSTATSTFSTTGGINLTSGCFSISGTCLTSTSGANPSGTIGLSAVNGSATTFLRSDGAPALSQAIVPTWTGLHTFSAGFIDNASSTFTVSPIISPLATPAGTFVAANASGQLIATSSPTGTNYWTLSGKNIYNNNSGNTGVGTTSPFATLSVASSSNSTTTIFSIYNNSNPALMISSMGTTTETFDSSGTFYVPTGVSNVSVVVVGGGGAGGNSDGGGGGGAGGYVASSSYSVVGTNSISVTVGAGGTLTNSGSNSVFGTITADGGGVGGASGSGSSGGSGGGAGYNGSAGSGTAGQGNNGGSSFGGSTSGGGGGGAGTAGGNAPSSSAGGAGGTGILNPLTNTYLAGGGGGGGNGGTGGTGGTGGGGAAGTGSSTGTAGTPNTGGGGGSPGTSGSAGIGGSGIVIVQYRNLSSTVSVGTTTANSLFTLQGILGTAVEQVWGLISQSYLFYEIDQVGHLWTGGPAPTCGTGCSNISGDDQTFRMETGSSQSSATANFANTWVNPLTGTSVSPNCQATEESASPIAVGASTTPTTVIVYFASSLTSKEIAVTCQNSSNYTY